MFAKQHDDHVQEYMIGPRRRDPGFSGWTERHPMLTRVGLIPFFLLLMTFHWIQFQWFFGD